MTGIDIVIEIRKLLNVPAITTLLEGGKVWQHNRPRNSEFTDIVISIPEYKGAAMIDGYVDINVHTPNLDEYYPIAGGPEDGTFPDLAKLKQVTDAILPLITNIVGFTLHSTIVGVPIRDKDGNWFSNIRVEFSGINLSDGVAVSLLTETSLDDGYGGVTVALTEAWTGLGVKVDIKKGSQLNVNAGRYEFNLMCDWILPDFDIRLLWSQDGINAVSQDGINGIQAGEYYAPQKNMQLHAPDGTYVINGIVGLGGFWRLSTIRKDERY